MENKVYKHLTNEEWNAVSLFTHNSKMDLVMDITGDENGDYFYDLEEDCQVPFEEGLSLMADNIADSGVVFAEESFEHRHIIEDIFRKFCENDKLILYVKNVNKILDKQTENSRPKMVSDILDYELKDDNSCEFGGISHEGETVEEFMFDYTEEPWRLTVNALNDLLTECGIAKIVLDK